MADPKQLLQMLQGDPRFGALAALCDEFNLDERLAAVRGLGKAEMTKLYERAAGQGQVNDRLREFYEVFILCNEVGFATQRYDHTRLSVCSGLGDDNTFFGFTVGAQCSYFLTFLAQVVYCFFEIAVTFYQCFSTVHHTGTSLLAQLVYIRCCNCCHELYRF